MKKNLAILYCISGLIGVLFSFIITIEKITLIQNPEHISICNLQPSINCATVMMSPQASLFGFPNSLLGIMGYSIVATIGFAMLSGAEFKKWFWIGDKIGLTLALIFIYWLFYQSVFELRVLCLFCIVIWAITIPLLPYQLLREKSHLIPVLGLMYGVILISILAQFWFLWF